MSSNKDAKRVSIVLPTHNGEEHLKQAVESCLSQTYQNLELIVVDDGSTDGTPLIVSVCKDSRLIYVRKDLNLGMPHALNSGFERASGGFFTWTSDDNYYAEDAIENMLEFLVENEGQFVYCDFYRFEESDPQDMKLVRLPDKPVLREHNDIGPCFLYTRKVFEITGSYDDSARLAEDYDYWLRVYARFSMQHLDRPLYYYRSRKGSLSSRQNEIQAVSVLLRTKHHFIGLDEAAKQFSAILAEAAVTARGKYYTRASVLARQMWIWARFRVPIEGVFRDFDTRSIDMEEAKARLMAYYRR